MKNVYCIDNSREIATYAVEEGKDIKAVTPEDYKGIEKEIMELKEENALMLTYIYKLEWLAGRIREETPNPEAYLTDVETWIKQYPRDNRPHFIRYQPLSEAISDRQMMLEFDKAMIKKENEKNNAPR